MNLLQQLRERVAAAAPDGADPAAFGTSVRPATDPRFGDYQANGCMALAKQLGRNPRELAQNVASSLRLQPMAPPPRVEGPGFLNITLDLDWLQQAVTDQFRDPSLGIEPASPQQTVVIDYSSPNVAKPMHVGHIRSTVIGDSLARMHDALGHTVIRDNHLGDWGAQFGMILWGWKNHADNEAYAANPVQELARLYRLTADTIKQGDRAVEAAARAETARLHSGDPASRRLWEQFMPHCLEALQAIYERLDVHFDVQLGESAYDDRLHHVVADLESRGLAHRSEGATVVFVEGSETPLLIRKSDQAFNYATTDLATIAYRVETWNPDLILYVVDHRQSEHFKLLFDVARRWGFTHPRLVHVAFGTILGDDRRPFRTREGDVVGLESLLDEAVRKARAVIDANSPDLDETERKQVAEIVGLGAIKYADLSQNRTSDYVFDWDKMMALNGNTATYMQYAYARCRSIFRKGDTTPEAIRAEAPTIQILEPAERALALQLLRLPETLVIAVEELRPNVLTDYLFGLTKAYSAFFEACPVLKAPSPALRSSRLALCDLTARAIAQGLRLLGIQVVDRM